MPATAQAQPPAGGAPAPSQGFDLFGTPTFIILLIVIFYFMILRPQKQERSRVESMRDSIKKGDRVKSIGGIIGVVVSVDKESQIVSVQVDKNTKIDFDRDAIATVSAKGEE